MINPVFRRSSLALALLLCCQISRTADAARTDTLVDSRTLIAEGVRRHDEGRYKEAIALYKQVPEGDTNYALALNEQALSALSDSAFTESRRLALQGLALPGKPGRRDFLLLLGHANDYLGDMKTALHYYDTLITLNPYDHQPWYEKGAAYYIQKDYEKARYFFRQSMMLNPNHFRSHFNTGMSLYHQGRLAEAYLALCFSLFTTSNAESAASIVDILMSIQQQTDEVLTAWRKRNPATINPSFEEADAIINAKLALSKDYKFESVLSEDATVKTLHLILEKVKFDGRDTSLVMQYYMPFYKQVYEAGKFDEMVLLMFSGFNFDVIEKHAKKHSGSIKDLSSDLSNYTEKILSTQVYLYEKRKNAPELYTFLSSDNLIIVGGLQSKSPLKFRPGAVQIYKDGYFYGKGTANAAGEKDGEWTFYYDNGNLRSRETFRDGKEIGESFYYRRNGTPSSSTRFDNQGNVVEEREYTYNGVLDAVTKRRGESSEYTSYHRNGSIEYQAHLKDGNVSDAVLRTAFDDGRISQELHFADGKRSGICKEYYQNGKLREESEYKDGKRNGKSVSYHQNGNLRYKAGYANDKLDGVFEEYNEDGKLIERVEYRKGLKSGINEEFTPDGRLYGSITYKDDLPVAYRYTDEQGKVLSEVEKGGDMSRLVTYYSNGNKRSELPLRRGKVDGLVKYYYQTGSVSKHMAFVDDKREGPVKEFFRNGRMSSECSHHENEVQGRYKGNNDAGGPRSDGYLNGSDRCGMWRFFHPDGKLEEEDFYVSGKRNGPQKTFRGNGSLQFTTLYDLDMLEGLIEYDTAGRELRRFYYPAGNGVYDSHGFNGKTDFTVPLHNGKFDGPYTRYFSNGSVSERGFFKYGETDSTVTGFHPNGQKAVTGQLRKGKRDGLWVFYDDAGQKIQESNYSEGEREGVEKIWLAGNLHSEKTYHDGDHGGREIHYGENGEVAAILIYKNAVLQGYTYHGKDGKELPMIPLKNATGHVTTTYPNGQKGVDYQFVEGRLEGPALRWYSNGKQAQARQYEAGTGDAVGLLQRWSPSGQLVYEARYTADIMNGRERIWDASGRLVRSVEYSANGTKNGISQSIDPVSGKKASIRYFYDEEVSLN